LTRTLKAHLGNADADVGNVRVLIFWQMRLREKGFLLRRNLQPLR